MSMYTDPTSYANLNELRQNNIHLDLVMSFEGELHAATSTHTLCPIASAEAIARPHLVRGPGCGDRAAGSH